MTEEELDDLSASLIKDVTDIVTDFSTASDSMSFRTASGDSRHSFTDSTYQRSILNTLSNFYSSKIRGILPPDLKWSDDGKYIEGVSEFMQKSVLIGKEPLFKVEEFLD